ncbi:MAG: flavoprotein, partial [Candidatus Thiodiazotropha taylori]|nr:flavoprotein [Candidatus Thiodiazotropha taylori]
VALRIPRQAVSKELIGQLILILISTHESKQGSDWKLGVVKRAMNSGDNLLEVGVQFVAGKLEPITLRLAKLQNEEESNPDHGAIFIDQGHNNRSSLIVPKHFFVIGQEYRVEEMIPSPSISPLQQLETTAHFERFRIKSV